MTGNAAGASTLSGFAESAIKGDPTGVRLMPALQGVPPTRECVRMVCSLKVLDGLGKMEHHEYKAR
jgi:hypothetical protein